jgi:hypothetical protein
VVDGSLSQAISSLQQFAFWQTSHPSVGSETTHAGFVSVSAEESAMESTALSVPESGRASTKLSVPESARASTELSVLESAVESATESPLESPSGNTESAASTSESPGAASDVVESVSEEVSAAVSAFVDASLTVVESWTTESDWTSVVALSVALLLLLPLEQAHKATGKTQAAIRIVGREKERIMTSMSKECWVDKIDAHSQNTEFFGRSQHIFNVHGKHPL